MVARTAVMRISYEHIVNPERGGSPLVRRAPRCGGPFPVYSLVQINESLDERRLPRVAGRRAIALVAPPDFGLLRRLRALVSGDDLGMRALCQN